MLEYVIGPEGYNGSAKSILCNGKCPYNGKTAQEYLDEGCTIVDEDALYQIVDAYEKSLCGHWAEITEKQYDDALNVLPPMKWYDGGFFVSEALTGTVHAFYQELDGKYYSCNYQIYAPRSEILNSLKKHIQQEDSDA